MNETMLKRMEAAYWRARKAGHSRNKCLRAVLQEMREPTEALIAAAPYTLCGMSSFDPPVIGQRIEVEDLWRKLIDAALSESETDA